MMKQKGEIDKLILSQKALLVNVWRSLVMRMKCTLNFYKMDAIKYLALFWEFQKISILLFILYNPYEVYHSSFLAKAVNVHS